MDKTQTGSCRCLFFLVGFDRFFHRWIFGGRIFSGGSRGGGSPRGGSCFGGSILGGSIFSVSFAIVHRGLCYTQYMAPVPGGEAYSTAFCISAPTPAIFFIRSPGT